MATNFGNSSGSGFFIIDDNDTDTSSRFQIFHNATPNPPSTPADSKCLFTIKEGSSDGEGRLLLGDYSSPAFEIDWTAHEILLSDNGDWWLRQETSGRDLHLESKGGIRVVVDLDSGTHSESFTVYNGSESSGNALFEVLNDDEVWLGAGELKFNWSGAVGLIELGGSKQWEIVNGSTDANADIRLKANDNLDLYYNQIAGEEDSELRILNYTALVFYCDTSGDGFFENKLTVKDILTTKTDANIEGDLTVDLDVKVDNNVVAQGSVLAEGEGRFHERVRIEKPAASVVPHLRIQDTNGTNYYFWVTTGGEFRGGDDAPQFANQDTGTLIATL